MHSRKTNAKMCELNCSCAFFESLVRNENTELVYVFPSSQMFHFPNNLITFDKFRFNVYTESCRANFILVVSVRYNAYYCTNRKQKFIRLSKTFHRKRNKK